MAKIIRKPFLDQNGINFATGKYDEPAVLEAEKEMKEYQLKIEEKARKRHENSKKK